MSAPHSASLAMSQSTAPLSYRPLRRLSTLLYGRPGLLLAILLGPPCSGLVSSMSAPC